MNFRKILFILAAATIATAAGCTSSDGHDHSSSGGHSSEYPSCDAIIKACHLYDIGPGPVHDCHDVGHAAKSDADCAPKKDACLKTCNDAAMASDGGMEMDGSHSGHDAGGD